MYKIFNDDFYRTTNGMLALILELNYDNNAHKNLSNLLGSRLYFRNFGCIISGSLRFDILFFHKSYTMMHNDLSTNLIYEGDFIDLSDSEMFAFKHQFLDMILNDFTKEDQLICDTFCGTGSVLKWCIKNDRDFVGWGKNMDRFLSLQ